ncbi:hypothetical protein [Collinsella aerofaciens]|uniref:hypothetical protein n=1 Tax=Collinsella aerofaciens TaxID=74426 RepID=UPI003D7945FA
MSNGSCSLLIEGKGKISVSIDKCPSMPSMSFTGLQGRGMGRVVEEKAAIRCALRQAGFDIPMANVRIHIDESAHEFGHKCIENACAQGIAIASGQAKMPAGGRVSAVEIEIDGSTLGFEPAKDRLERSLDNLCDEKQAEADLIEGDKGRETRFVGKEIER